jgi:hypothetical protein
MNGQSWLAGLLVAAITLASAPDCQAKAQQTAKLTREEVIVLNLKRGPRSTGFFLLESLKFARQMDRDLDRAARQLEGADSQYARSIGRPDDRFFAGAGQKVEKCREHVRALTQALQEAREELKSSIEQALVTDYRR